MMCGEGLNILNLYFVHTTLNSLLLVYLKLLPCNVNCRLAEFWECERMYRCAQRLAWNDIFQRYKWCTCIM